ncbi:XdhC/CoxI family protein [Streptomyces sp. NPDC048278]|uniref:XdhC family protein n=1 Tax=Streptomyces sp. NPDC048278 TaxID=3155809 RepID=UPI0034168B2A
MLNLAEELWRWCEQGRDFAVATVVSVTGSAPAQPGSGMAVGGSGEVIGTVSTACVEASVHELCRQALADGRPLRARFGSDIPDPFAVVPLCGGSLDVLVTPVPAGAADRPVYEEALRRAAAGEAVTLIRPVDGMPDGTPAPGSLLVRSDGSCVGELPKTARTFADAVAARPRLIVFGSGSPAPALVRMAALLGYRTTVCDARPVFTTPERFPEADEVVVDWPHRYLERTPTDHRTVLCVLTHDAKFEVPLLAAATRLPVAYVGVMGSRSTHASRLAQLREAGVPEERLAALRAPVGLDLGGRTPEETALSVLAEVVAERYGGTGLPLSGLRGPVHAATAGQVTAAMRRLAGATS